MKKLISLLIAALFCTVAVRADSIVYPLTANTVSNLFSSGKIIDNITVTASTTNITTLKFYDSSNTSTTYVQAAYVRYANYATNYSVVFTNEANVVLTNSFSGIYTYPTSVSIATNTIPILQTIVVPASAQRSKDVNISTLRGLNVVPNYDAIVEVTYRNNP